MPLERPLIDKPVGDIPFVLGIEDIVIGDGDEATSGARSRCTTRGSRSPPARSSTPPGIAASRSPSSSARGK